MNCSSIKVHHPKVHQCSPKQIIIQDTFNKNLSTVRLEDNRRWHKRHSNRFLPYSSTVRNRKHVSAPEAAIMLLFGGLTNHTLVGITSISDWL